ncbi:MAG TPA: methionyl-tRNA formyltransferase [bacterium]|nr:methionyl-tRNA formyltransferase [bacterium]
MRIILAGSPAFAVPILQRLIASQHQVICVVTQPARPAGRGLVLADPPVKQAATEAGIEVHQPEKFNAREFLDVLAAKEPDLIVTAAYGRIFKRRALDLPKLGCVNLHASLLPRYRGVAPINWAIINGERETGVTTFFMEEGVDTGDIILARATAIDDNETAGQLTERLSLIGAEVLLETCDAIEQGTAPRVRQDASQASYAPKLAKDDGRVTWEAEALSVHNRIRGTSPWPGAFCDFRGQRLKLLSSGLGGPGGSPGRIIAIDSRMGILVSCKRESVWLKTVQAQGKRPTAGADFARGYRIKVDDAFG